MTQNNVGNEIKDTDMMLVGTHRHRVRFEKALNFYDAIGSVKQLQGKVDFELSEIGELFGKLDPEIVKFLEYNINNIKKRFTDTLGKMEKERQKALDDTAAYKEFA